MEYVFASTLAAAASVKTALTRATDVDMDIFIRIKLLMLSLVIPTKAEEKFDRSESDEEEEAVINYPYNKSHSHFLPVTTCASLRSATSALHRSRRRVTQAADAGVYDFPATSLGGLRSCAPRYHHDTFVPLISTRGLVHAPHHRRSSATICDTSRMRSRGSYCLFARLCYVAQVALALF